MWPPHVITYLFSSPFPSLIMILRVVEVEDTMIGCLIILLKEKLAGNLFWTYP